MVNEKAIQKKVEELEEQFQRMGINVEKKIEPWSEGWQLRLTKYDGNGEVIEEFILYPSFDEYGNITKESSEIVGIEYKNKDNTDWDSTYDYLSKYEAKYGIKNFYDLLDLPAVFIYYLFSYLFSGFEEAE